MRRWLSMTIALTLSLAACSTADLPHVPVPTVGQPLAPAGEPQVEQPSGPTGDQTPDENGGADPTMKVDGMASWDGEFLVLVANGWRIAPCEGDAPMWCVSDQDRHVGVVEFLAYPLTGEPESLAVRAQSFLDDFRADRAVGCPHTTFRADEPVDAEIAGRTGIRFGFELVQDGVVVERHVLYWVVVDGYHVTVNAGAYADNGCMERIGEFLPDDLATLNGSLDIVVAEAALPELSTLAGIL